MNKSFLYKKVAPVIKKAGALLLSFYTKQVNIYKKKDGSFVSQADKEVESFIINELSKIIINASFYSEEKFFKEKSLNSDYCWVIDPLDGTTNFLYSIPYFCISIALVYQEEPIFGMIYNPIAEEVFYGEKNCGSFLIVKNKSVKIGNQESRELENSIAIISPVIDKKRYGEYSNIIKNIAQKFYTTRYYGAIALDIASIATGRFQAGFYIGAAWWDYAAAKVIVEESSCKITDFKGTKISKNSKTIIVAESYIYKKILSFFVSDV